MTAREKLTPPDPSDRDDPPDFIEGNDPDDAMKRRDPDRPILDHQNPDSDDSAISRTEDSVGHDR